MLAKSMAVEEKTEREENQIMIWKGKWNKKEYPVYFDRVTLVGDLKEQLEDETGVKQHKLKLVGLKLKKEYKRSGHKITDETLVYQCTIPKRGFLIMGTLEKNAFFDTDQDFDILDDEDFDTDQAIENKKQNQAKLHKIIQSTHINHIISPIGHKKGRKLLVLDIDYTIFDMGSKTESWATLKRPFTEYLMENCYKHYDIVVWSQTSWRWIEIKLTEMGMLHNSKYRITFVLDKKAMFTIKSRFKNGEKKHYVKPLELIWSKYKGVYDDSNTIHIDDLARNFALNAQCGLTIKPYKNSHICKHTDKELLYLTHYLVLIAKQSSLKSLNHNKWKEYLEKNNI